MSETKDKKYKDLSNAIERLLDAAAQCEIPIVEIQFSNVQSQRPTKSQCNTSLHVFRLDIRDLTLFDIFLLTTKQQKIVVKQR